MCHIVELTKVLFDSFLGRSTKYSKYSPEQKAEICRYAASTNIASAARNYQVDFPNLRKQKYTNSKRYISNNRNPLAKKLPS